MVYRLVDCLLGDDDCGVDQVTCEEAAPKVAVKEAENYQCRYEVALSHVVAIFVRLARHERRERTKQNLNVEESLAQERHLECSAEYEQSQDYQRNDYSGQDQEVVRQKLNLGIH